MKRFSFIKLSAAGNDFILIDKRDNEGISLTKDQTINLCHRKNGIGADGIILFDDSSSADFSVEHFNSDGTGNTLCGNGARSAIFYAKLSGRLSDELTDFLYNGNRMKGEVLGEGNIKLYLEKPEKIKTNFKIKAANQLINASYADVGSPHIVIKIGDILKDPKLLNSNYDNISEVPVKELGKEIRSLKDFAPSGTNVNFIFEKNDLLYIRTYERGVEDETLACGTGVVASALVSFINDKVQPPINFKTKGGDVLIVDFQVKDEVAENISLTGPAKQIFSGNISV